MLEVIEDNEHLTYKENIPIIFNDLSFPEEKISPFIRKIRNRFNLMKKKNDISLGYEFVIITDRKKIGEICQN